MAVAVVGLLCATWARAEESKVTLKVRGMTCGSCSKSVESSLKKLDGVKSVEIDLDTGKTVVTCDTSKVKTEKLVAAVKEAGFKCEKPSEKK